MTREKPPCVTCGEPSARAGWCAKHYPPGANEKTAWALSSRRRKIAAGICLKCKAKAMPGKRYCEKHKDTYKEISKRNDTSVAMKIVKRAMRDAQRRRDAESIFLDPDFEEKHTEVVKKGE